ILDKTGTITAGKPVLTDLIWKSNDGRFKQVLYSMELQSEHPLAAAVVNKLKAENISKVKLAQFESITARGVKAVYEDDLYFVGNKKLLEENNIIITDELWAEAKQLQEQAKTVIYFAGAGGEALALIALADQIKPTSKAAVEKLQKQGIEVYMLTGDNEQTAQAVAREVGIKNYKANLLPSDKSDFVRDLQQKGKIVAMVGDGINDAEALAQADVGIAMGKGTDIAMDVARITLTSSDLQLIPKALKLSGKTVKGIKQNLFWAFIYNVIGIPIAAGVLYPLNGFLLDPMIAAAAMALSSVSVVGNSLRLKFVDL
ncbi:MAG TPA: HAD-IC family P-type ATPase, partial [Cyclobacteriaceae bacterium]|nr:HAD-IC family P-type ATPase [Cyclobacteriaceae bacterium]